MVTFGSLTTLWGGFKWYYPRMGLVKGGLGENKIFQFKGKTISKTSNKANDQRQGDGMAITYDQFT